MKIGLLNCGGTITECYNDDGSFERLTAQDIVARTAGYYNDGYDVDVVDSCDLSFASVCRARDVMRSDRVHDAFVICCGTDAMEDVAYAAMLLFDRDRPVILTGSSVPGGDSGSDALRNLVDSALAARSAPIGDGPLVVFSGRIFDPASIVKVWPQAMQPFGPETAILGSVDAGIASSSSSRGCEETYSDLDVQDLGARVAIVTETFGALVGFPDVSQLDGLVVAGKGAGGFSAETEILLREAARRIPVVLSTRCSHGFRVNPAIRKYTYDRPHELGLTTESYDGLNASKARIRLIAELGRKGRIGKPLNEGHKRN